MSRQKSGLDLEHLLAKEIYDLTGGSILPLRGGYSGNQAVPSPDLLIPFNGSLRAVEIKSSSQDVLRVYQEDLEDIVKWSMDMTEVPTYPYLSVKFVQGNYEIYTGRLKEPWDLDKSLEMWAEESPFDAHTTNSGNLSIGHPTKYDSEVLSSIKSPGDASAVIRDLSEDDYANTDVLSKDIIGVRDIVEEYPDVW